MPLRAAQYWAETEPTKLHFGTWLAHCFNNERPLLATPAQKDDAFEKWKARWKIEKRAAVQFVAANRGSKKRLRAVVRLVERGQPQRAAFDEALADQQDGYLEFNSRFADEVYANARRKRRRSHSLEHDETGKDQGIESSEEGQLHSEDEETSVVSSKSVTVLLKSPSSSPPLHFVRPSSAAHAGNRTLLTTKQRERKIAKCLSSIELAMQTFLRRNYPGDADRWLRNKEFGRLAQLVKRNLGKGVTCDADTAALIIDGALVVRNTAQHERADNLQGASQVPWPSESRVLSSLVQSVLAIRMLAGGDPYEDTSKPGSVEKHLFHMVMVIRSYAAAPERSKIICNDIVEPDTEFSTLAQIPRIHVADVDRLCKSDLRALAAHVLRWAPDIPNMPRFATIPDVVSCVVAEENRQFEASRTRRDLLPIANHFSLRRGWHGAYILGRWGHHFLKFKALRSQDSLSITEALALLTASAELAEAIRSPATLIDAFNVQIDAIIHGMLRHVTTYAVRGQEEDGDADGQSSDG